VNENLRHALIGARLQAVDVASALGVDPKTVERWITGRIPYPRHRWAVADLIGVEECDLWPELDQRRRTAGCGLVAMYPHRWTVPQNVWRRVFRGAEHEIDILAYSGLFLAEDAGILRILSERASAGVRVCVLLGDPDDLHVADRGAEEGLGADVMAARIRNALTLYRPLREVEGVELRLHRSPLYASIYRADADVMVNPHIYATPAAQAPILHFRTTEEGGPANAYLDAFENVWNEARPVTNAH
jgi:lambda repressor-like predicted transcriptional regulator